MIPLLHDFEGETVLVVGGGPVGARKARRFAREARTVVVSPAFADADFGDAEPVRAAPDPDGVSEWVDRLAPALVVAATDDDGVNEAAERAARDAGAMAELVGELRADLKAADVPSTDRREAIRAVVRSSSVWKALQEGTPNARQEADRLMEERHD